MKTKWQATVESLNHWKEMVERMKWLIESGYDMYVDPLNRWLFVVLNTGWTAKYCPLCQIRVHYSCIPCPLYRIGSCCEKQCSPWVFTTNSHTFTEFVNRAEQEMIPALYAAKRWCEENE